MSLHLQRFVDRIRGFEARGAQDFVMSLQDAKDMHAEITRLLLDLQQLREAAASKGSNEPIVIDIDGGSF